MIDFYSFQEIVAKHEPLFAVQCSPVHWQVKGGARIVNYYPFAKGGATIYVQGAVQGDLGGSAHDVIRIANEGPEDSRAKAKRCKNRSNRKKMLASYPYCCWCGRKLDRYDATVEHLLPLSKGGSNRADNLALACKTCNNNRGSEMRVPLYTKAGGLPPMSARFPATPNTYEAKL